MKNATFTRMTLLSGLIFMLITGNVSSYAGENVQKTEKAEAEKSSKNKEHEQLEKGARQESVLHNEIVVTATRTEKTLFDVPQPVSVVNQKKIRELAPNNVSELLPEMPGTDVVGVGANQSRPIIRGLRGQRILLLTDGIRLSSSRRTQTFGEIPALVDVSGIERVEVVRGPASVLYGSEAIGGVVNIITRVPVYNREGTDVFGSLGYRYSSADNQHKGFAEINGHVGHLGFMLSGTYRNADDYTAPAGSFGKIALDKETLVHDTGVEDRSFNLFLGYRLAEQNDISLKYEYYRANNAGFGYVDPTLYSPGDPLIQLLYPQHKMQKITLKYENRALHFILADGMSLVGYHLQNTRTFDTNISMNFFPGAGMKIRSSNFTDVETLGTRLELTKVLFRKHILTYGLDFFQDNSENTDTNIMEIFGFGPIRTHVDTAPKVPNAFFRSLGLFIQDDIDLSSRSSLILGLRYQNVHAETEDTPGLDDPPVKSTDKTLVGSANVTYDLTDSFKLTFSLGRGFRSPNLPERFYQGVTPDGGGYQVQNPELESETSLNVDIGFRFRWQNIYVETSFFRNVIYDGIQIVPTGRTVGRIPEYKNVNIDKLRLQGLELLIQLRFDFGLSLMADFSYVTSENLTNPELMYADTYGSKVNLNIRYTFPNDLFWIEYHIRHSGDQKDVNLVNNPIGEIIPGFTVHSLRAGITLFKDSLLPQQVTIIIGNLTDTLYSEFSNASFFRPAPKRHVVLAWSTRF
ncbi:MAG: TonB-dependent receptor plug domain-containing protein [Candidatus Aminicenantales bacterium]